MIQGSCCSKLNALSNDVSCILCLLSISFGGDPKVCWK